MLGMIFLLKSRKALSKTQNDPYECVRLSKWYYDIAEPESVFFVIQTCLFKIQNFKVLRTLKKYEIILTICSCKQLKL